MDADREALLTAAERLNADVIEKAEARLISRPSDGPHAKILAKATQHARALFGQLQHRRHYYPNPHRQLDELQQACAKLNQLLDLMDGIHQSSQGGEKEKEKEKTKPHQQQQQQPNNHFAATDALSHPSAKQFWAAHFGPQVIIHLPIHLFKQKSLLLLLFTFFLLDKAPPPGFSSLLLNLFIICSHHLW